MNAERFLDMLFHVQNVDLLPNDEFKPNVDDQFRRFASPCASTVL